MEASIANAADELSSSDSASSGGGGGGGGGDMNFSPAAVFYEVQVSKHGLSGYDAESGKRRVKVHRWRVKRRYKEFKTLHSALLQESGARAHEPHHSQSSSSSMLSTSKLLASASPSSLTSLSASSSASSPSSGLASPKVVDFMSHFDDDLGGDGVDDFYPDEVNPSSSDGSSGGNGSSGNGSSGGNASGTHSRSGSASNANGSGGNGRGGVDMRLPPLRRRRSRTYTDRDFVAARRRKLNEYLEALIRHPVWGGCHELLVFLDAERDHAAPPTGTPRGGSSSKAAGEEGATAGKGGGGGQRGRRRRHFGDTPSPARGAEDEEELRSLGWGAAAMQAQLAQSSSYGFGGGSLESSSSSSSAAAAVAAVASSVESRTIDERVLRNIQQRLYSILKELFDIDRTNVVRRNFGLLPAQGRQDHVHRHHLQDHLRPRREGGLRRQDASFPTWLVATVWSGKGFSMRQPLGDDWPTATLQEQRQLKVRGELLSSRAGPSSLMATRPARRPCKLYEFLQCSVIVRSLLYSALDLLWKQLFPEDPELRELYGMELEWDDALPNKGRY